MMRWIEITGKFSEKKNKLYSLEFSVFSNEILIHEFFVVKVTLQNVIYL